MAAVRLKRAIIKTEGVLLEAPVCLLGMNENKFSVGRR